MTTLAAEPLGRPALPDSAADAVYRKVAVRLIPLLFLCYIAALGTRGVSRRNNRLLDF